MSEIEIKVSELKDSPWRFKVMSSRDFDNLVSTIETYGPHTVNPILVVKIDGRYYIIDGHARRDAISEAGFSKATCVIAEWVRNFNDLRIWSFRLNRHGHYNPLELLRMIKEDMEILGNVDNVAKQYGMSDEYLQNLLKLDALDDTAKNIIDKVINVARKKYQFILEQINTYHLSYVAELEPKQQIEVLEWLFHDIMYGPPNESIVSLPSIYEVINEIEKHRLNATVALNDVRRKNHAKQHQKNAVSTLEFRCSCGNKFHVDFFTGEVYEHIEEDNLIIRKKIETMNITTETAEKLTKKKMKNQPERKKTITQ